MSVEPNARGYWKRELERIGDTDMLELSIELDELLRRPAMLRLRALLIGAHDELVGEMVDGPVRALPLYTKRAGVVSGLASFDRLVTDIREGAERARNRLLAEADRLNHREGVRA